MKFTKTVAQALANKTYLELARARTEKLKNFTLNAEQEKKAKELVDRYVAIREEFDAVTEELKTSGKNFCFYSHDPKKVIYDKYIKRIVESLVPTVPSRETLIDDFLIESLEAVNAEELIAKVTAKYTT